MPIPEGVEITAEARDRIVDDLRRDAAVYENISREMQEPHGPDLAHLALSGLEKREGHRPRAGFLEPMLLAPILAAAPLEKEGLWETPPATVKDLRRCYEIHQEAARRAAELLA
jgi:hypothetical protein